MTKKEPRCVNCGHLLQIMDQAFDIYTGENIWDHKRYANGDISCFCGCLEAEMPEESDDSKKLLEIGLDAVEYLKKKRKTKQYIVSNRKTRQDIGMIKWYNHWRRYVFFPYVDTIFDSSCLKEIVEFLDKLMNERKEQMEVEK